MKKSQCFVSLDVNVRIYMCAVAVLRILRWIVNQWNSNGMCISLVSISGALRSDVLFMCAYLNILCVCGGCAFFLRNIGSPASSIASQDHNSDLFWQTSAIHWHVWSWFWVVVAILSAAAMQSRDNRCKASFEIKTRTQAKTSHTLEATNSSQTAYGMALDGRASTRSPKLWIGLLLDLAYVRVAKQFEILIEWSISWDYIMLCNLAFWLSLCWCWVAMSAVIFENSDK